MSSRITAHIQMDQYLIDFLYSVYQSSNKEEALFLPKRNRLNKLLSLLLTKPPKELPESISPKAQLHLLIPFFEKININSINYLSHRSQQIFTKQVKRMFDVEFFDFVDICLINAIDKIDAVNLFIEKYDLPDDMKFQERLLKKLQRSKKILKKHPTKTYKKISA